nr:MAG TPA: Major capsid protein [Caudoviricetes sp.]
MANSISAAKKFVPLLDEAYRKASLTSILDGDPTLVREGANFGELIIPIMNLQGLGDYDRNSGYVDGDVTLANETIACNYDRGRMFNVDTMDNIESASLAFGMLANEFIKNKVAPELDAFRLACYASKAGVTKVSGALSTGADVVSALRAATTQMDEDEVPMEDRYLFITPTLHGLVQDMDTTKSREVLARFAGVVDIPQSRFYSKLALKTGKLITTGSGDTLTTDDQREGGFMKATGGKDLNFMVIHKPAIIQFTKHVAPKIISPELNQTADAYRFAYHNVGIADVYENKLAGVYVHKKP